MLKQSIPTGGWCSEDDFAAPHTSRFDVKTLQINELKLQLIWVTHDFTYCGINICTHVVSQKLFKQHGKNMQHQNMH